MQLDSLSNRIDNYRHCNEPHYEKTNNLHIRKHRPRPAALRLPQRPALRLPQSCNQLSGSREAVTTKLNSAFVLATQIVQLFFYLYPKFQVSILLLRLYSSVCVRPGRKPHCWFSHDAAQMM